jgi:DNA-binding IclR family transcriptional regulator
MKEKNTNTIPAVEKTVLYLEALASSRAGMAQPELCEKLGITQSTCYRITQTLLGHGWIFRRGKTFYDIAPGMLAITDKLSDLTKKYEMLQPQLDFLSLKTGLSCKLSICQGQEQFSVLRAESPKPMSVSGRVGVHFPLIEGSVGSALLMMHSKDDIINLIDDCPYELAEKEDSSLIFNRIDNLKAKGYTVNLEHNRWNIEAVSVPVFNEVGEVEAAITILGFADDFKDGELEKKVKILIKVARICGELL